MKRRDLFLLPLAAIPAAACKPEYEAYTIGTPQCASCFHIMQVHYNVGDPILECVNSECSHYEVRYRVPKTPVERV